MRFHVLALPHTHVTPEFSACAFTNKAFYFCEMMRSLGHHVTLYAGPKSTANVDEFVPCVTEKARIKHIGDQHYTSAPWGAKLWDDFNKKAVREIKKRIQPEDFICILGGDAHRPIVEQFPHNIHAEIGVGYGGCFANFKVFESYAWMHTVYGARSNNNPCGVDGTWYDVVIPGYLDPEQYPDGSRGIERFMSYSVPPVNPDDEYYMFVGRLIDRKGYAIAQDVCERLGRRLILAGPGEFSGYGEYVGVIGPEERGRLMAGATALFAPTKYIEPFGNVAVEAMACGTPVISTDFGAFTETVTHGETGFRCRTFAEFVKAADDVRKLDRDLIRDYASNRYSIYTIRHQYEAYFKRLAGLRDPLGWYAMPG